MAGAHRIAAAALLVAPVAAAPLLATPPQQTSAARSGRPPLERVELQPYVRAHLDGLLAHGRDVHGTEISDLWVASLDLDTLRYPVGQPKAAAGQRVYRHIDAPFGSTLYWDLPQIEAAVRLSALTGDPSYRDAAEAYVRQYLTRAVGDDGLIAWGNHYFYDVFADEVVRFGYAAYGSPAPAPSSDRGHHEMRPLFAPWELLWEVDPAATARHLVAMAAGHLVGGTLGSGDFDRHANVGAASASQYPFLEAGAVLVDAFSWYGRRVHVGGGLWAELADRVALASWSRRDPATGLVPNQYATARWDRDVCTSEIGLWAQGLLRAAERQPGFGADWERMAADAVRAWLRHAWDPARARYVGKVRIADGAPEFARTTPYQPGDDARVWNAFFPTHDYAIALADACVTLYERTGDPDFATAARRWARILREERPPVDAADGYGAYAELYGRGISFLLRASSALGDPALRRQAEELAYEALTVLWDDGMFRGHGGEARYDAVDGVGFLLQALLDLETMRVPGRARALARWEFGVSGSFDAGCTWHDPRLAAGAATAGPGLTLTGSTRGEPPPSLAATSVDADAPNLAGAVAAGDWHAITVAPSSGSLQPAYLLISLQRTGGADAPTGFAVRSSADGFRRNLAADTLFDDEFRTLFLPLVAPEFRALRGPLEIRVYFHGGSGGGNLYARMDNLVLYGRLGP